MKMKTGSLSWSAWLIAVLIVCSQTVGASEDVEREELTRILHEIRYLEKSLIIARTRADEEAVTTFDYDALADDLYYISEGISDHLNRIRREPRTLPAIDGEYRHGR